MSRRRRGTGKSRKSRKTAPERPFRQDTRAPVLLVVVGLAVATVVAYAPVGGFGFVSYDDPQYVSDNAHVRQGLSCDGLRWALTHVHHGNWHPITTASWMLETDLFGDGPGARHVVNLALHVGNTLLLFWLLLRTTGAAWRSAAIAALFALHPLHVESVAWISSRKDLLSAGLGFGATLAWARWVRSRAWGWYAGATALFGLGLMAKPMLVTWPFVLLLLEVWPLRRFQREGSDTIDRKELHRALLDKLPLLVLTSVSIALTLWAQREGGALKDTPLYPLDHRLANAAVSYGTYLWRAVWIPTERSRSSSGSCGWNLVTKPRPTISSSPGGALGRTRRLPIPRVVGLIGTSPIRLPSSL